MIPFGAAIGAVAILRRRGWRGGPEGNGLGWLRGILWVIACLVLAGAAPNHWLAALSGAAALLAVPPIPLALFAVPLGLVRVAWAIQRAFGGTLAPFEGRVRPTLMAARAHLRRPSDRGARFIERYLDTCVELAGHGVLATALLALARGDRDRGVRLARALAGAAQGVVPAYLVAAAHEIVALDALARGDWAAVERPPSLGRRRAHLRLRFYAEVAEHAEAPAEHRAPAWIWVRWLLGGRRAQTLPIARWALRLPPPAPPAPIAATLDAHVALLARLPGRVRAADVAAAAASLDAYRASPEVLAGISRRALTLGGGVDGAIVRDEVVTLAEAELARVLLDEGLPVESLGPAGATRDAVRALVRERRVALLDALVREMGRRARAHADLPEADEWCAWLDVKTACDALLRDAGDVYERRRVFHQVYHALTSYAVRLINVRTARVLARDVCEYLRALAHATGAADAYEIVDKNAAACRADRLPPARGEAPFDDARMSKKLRYALAGCIFAAMAIVYGLVQVGAPAAVAVAVCLFVFVPIPILKRLVTAYESPDGLTLQSAAGRYVALPDNVRAVHLGPGPIVRVRLQRAPRWLSRRLFFVAASAEAARAATARLRAYAKPPAPSRAPEAVA
ncbi:MAG TPA: hypothetical protein VHV30_01710 [Polyangiaceae bacterium]|jgi:hypothetical protein|nr:hypothetical protein [Polyangiaceae bacterium]